MKQLRIVFVFVMAFVLLIGCESNKVAQSIDSSQSVEVDSEEDLSKETECLNVLKEGLQARWDIVNQDSATVDEVFKNKKDGIDKELSFISQYADKEFGNKEFGTLISKYITALEKQKAGVEFWMSDAKQYETLFNVEGYDVRSECLNRLVDEYEFTVDEDYNDNLQDVLSGIRSIMISAGETVTANTELGEVTITINALKKSDWKERADEEGDFFIGIMECIVENKSYSDPYNEGYVLLDNFVGVFDMDDIQKDTYSSSYDYKDFVSAAGGFFELAKGNKAKVAIPYSLSGNTEKVYININNEYDMFLDVK